MDLFQQENVLYLILEYHSHEEIKNWIQTCKFIYQWAQKWISGFFDYQWNPRKMKKQELLKWFCIEGNVNGVKYLISKCVRVEHSTELYFASFYNQYHVVRYLIKNKIYNAGCATYPLVNACRRGNIEMFNYLVSHGWEWIICSMECIQNACENGHLEMVKYLISLGAPIFENLLYSACKEGYLSIVCHLLEQKHFTQSEKENAFCFACAHNQLGIAQHFISLHVNPRCKNDYAIIESIKIHAKIETIQFLLDQGVDIHAHNEFTLIHACEFYNLEMVKFLVFRGARVNAQQNKPLIIASQIGNQEMIDFLFAHLPKSNYSKD